MYFFLLEMVWVLTREENPNVDTLQKAYAVLDKNKISKAFLLRTDQFNCNGENVSYSLADEIADRMKK